MLLPSTKSSRMTRRKATPHTNIDGEQAMIPGKSGNARNKRFVHSLLSLGLFVSGSLLAITVMAQDRQGKPGSLGTGRTPTRNTNSNRPAPRVVQPTNRTGTPKPATPTEASKNSDSAEGGEGSSNAKARDASLPGRSMLEDSSATGNANANKPTAKLAAKSSGDSQSAGPIDEEKNKSKTSAKPITVATDDEKNQVIAEGWEKPWACLFLTGRQHGYIEPCGCTGLENQKGGLNRRDTLLRSITDRGWDVVPIDAGDAVNRFGSQSEIKYTKTAEALKLMGYQAVMYGPEELQLSASDLLLTLTDSNGNYVSPFVAANVSILLPDTPDRFKIVKVGNRKIGITGVLGDESVPKGFVQGDITITPAIDSLKQVVPKLLEEKCDYYVLIAHTSLQETTRIAQAVPEFDLVVTAGGYGEPHYKPEPIEGTKSSMIQVGVKGMYAGIVGLYDDAETPVRYQRVALSSQFEDSPRIMDLFARYQKELENRGLAGLGLRPLSHPSTREFVGSEKCSECHTSAFEVWKNTPHAHATDSIMNPPGRGQVPRHFDPECLSCHVTGWNPQGFYPYTSGYESLEKTAHLVANGCENCHGPGAQHAAAEEGSSQVSAEILSRLREEMQLPLASAKEKCKECHDPDNSPNFHKDDNAFEVYWEKVKHYGKD